MQGYKPGEWKAVDIQTYTKAMQTKQQVPQMKNTLDCKFACSGSTMYGVE